MTSALTTSSPFKWRHFTPEIILMSVRWYLRYSLPLRDVEELLMERGLSVDRHGAHDQYAHGDDCRGRGWRGGRGQ